MKRSIFKACFSLCLLAIGSSVHADNRTAGASSEMMFIHNDLTENDLYAQLNAQDRAIYDKLDAQEREFVVRLVNAAPQLQVMHQRMKGQGQFHGQFQDRSFNRNVQQGASSDYQRSNSDYQR